MGLSSLSNLPCEVILDILDELLPVGPHTTAQSDAVNPVVSPSHLECRTSLFNVCLTSKTFYELGIPHLYRNPLVKTNRELFRFFCVLAKHPDRRPMVRSFAWAGVMWEHVPPVFVWDDFAAWADSKERQCAAVSAEFWDFVKDHWPRDGNDIAIAKRFGCNGGPNRIQDPKLLGSVLAMCPRIKCLFIMNGAQLYRGEYHCPELDAVETLYRLYKFDTEKELMDRIQPYGHPLLHGLETLAIEGHSIMEASWSTSMFLAALFQDSRSLRRIEIKYPPRFTEVLEFLYLSDIETPLTAGVNEVSLLFAQQPQDDMAAIVGVFPNLTSLHAEFRDGSDRPSDKFNLPPVVSEALLTVSETLEELSLTTSPATYPAEGHWLRFESYPPSLSTLNEMSQLKDLTTESIWLFGTEDPGVALLLPYLLPRSLVRLHLIDYWGNSDPAEFYPEFPGSCTPVEFYIRVFGMLFSRASVLLPQLKEVTFTSKLSDSNLQPSLLNADQAEEDETKSTGVSMQSLRRSFEKVGIRFQRILQGAAS